MTDVHPDAVLPSPVPARRRRLWLTILLSIVLFTAGAAVGSGVTLLVGVRHVRYVIQHPQEFPQRASQRLKKHLGLSVPQTTEVRSILARHQAVLQEIRRSTQPRVEAELEGIRADVAAILNPEQAAKWNALVKARIEAWLPPLP